MTHDAGRPPGHGPERHAIGITRTCLASGTVQLPFALAGALPEGELLVHDSEADEPLVLWSEPPRRLAGLAPFFERHELQVNDAVVLEIRGDDLRLATSKRPRRARPAVRPSTWQSVHEDAPERASEPEAVAEAHGGDEAGPDPTAADAHRVAVAEGSRANAGRPASPAAATPGDASPLDALRTEPPAQEDPDEIVDDAPRAPRVAVRPLGPEDAGAAPPAGRPVRPSDAASLRPGAWARLGRFARSLFGAGRGDAAARSGDAARRTRERDWTSAWDEPDEDEELAPTPDFVDDAPPPSPPTRPDRSSTATAPAGAPHGADEPDAPEDASPRTMPPTPHPTDAEAEVAGPADPVPPPHRADAAGAVDDVRDDPLNQIVLDEDEDVPDEGVPDEGVPDEGVGRDDAAAGGLPEPTPLFPDAVTGARPRRPIDETPSGVPARAERFLGGDLRTRLLRYLESPEMGSIAHAERIAKRFDLDVETAAEMLADIADEPPDGLRLRETRAGAWRIERTLRR